MSEPGRRLDAHRAAWRARGLQRTLRPPQGVDLTSNDYLGLAAHPAIRAALADALARGEPTGGTGSRLLTGQHQAWADLEARFATWQGTEAALFHATGFAANTGLLAALVEPGDVVLSDALNHASLIDGLRLTRAERVVVPHLDLAAYAHALEAAAGRPTWVVVESVYSMDGDRAPLPQLVALCRAHGASIIVDEAHATGLLGPTGAGWIEATGTRDGVFASVHTAGKALGQSGAFVCGSAAMVDWLVQKSRPFVFSTAPAPFLASGLRAAMNLVQDDPGRRARPAALGRRLRAALTGIDTGTSDTWIVPVHVGSPERATRLQSELQAAGWDARAIRPPTVPQGTSRVRLVLHAALEDAQVDQLAADVRAALNRLGDP